MLLIALFISPFPYIYNQLGIGYLLLVIIVNILCIFAIIKTLINVQNAEKTVSLLRSASALGIIAIIIGAIL